MMGRMPPWRDGRYGGRTADEVIRQDAINERIGFSLLLLLAAGVLLAVYCQVTWEMYGCPRCPACGQAVREATE